ncbi:MAG: hypothetical protein AAF433_01045 [Bacteroidota bacterium]
MKMHTSIKNTFFLIGALLIIQTGLFAQSPNTTAAYLTGNYSTRNFGAAEVNMLMQAHQFMRGARWEQSIMTYNALLGQRPNWAPALLGRAELFSRIGRDAEAEQDYDRAFRQNPLAARFLMAKGPNDLIQFLALYPADWFEEEGVVAPSAINQTYFSDFNLFEEQYEEIVSLEDSCELSEVLLLKIDGDRLASRIALDNPKELLSQHQALLHMQRGNLAMLNHDYLTAISYYQSSEQTNGGDWPEVTYNRALANILLLNYAQGCEDLNRANADGFSAAAPLLQSLCNF